MRAGLRRWLTCFFVALVLLPPVFAEAAESVSRLARRLSQEKDFRVRTQAALSLGASKSPSALKPLCGALSDPSATVRLAAAAAIAKLKQGGTDCLKSSLSSEKSARVRSSIRRALASLDPGPTIRESSTYYVAIGKATVVSGDADGTDNVVRSSMRRAAQALESLVIAPDGEAPEQAEAVFRKHKSLKGFYLAPKVFEPKYDAVGLKVKVEVAVFSYPEQALLGSFSVNLTAQSVSAGDKAAEAELLKMVAERALQKFSTNAGQF